jgi:hypothetical protein
LIGLSKNRLDSHHIIMLQEIRDELGDIEKFCHANNDAALKLRSLLKEIFQYSVDHSSKCYGPLNSLVVDNVDEEIIWEELQTRNNPLIRFIKKCTKKWLQDEKLKFIEYVDENNDDYDIQHDNENESSIIQDDFEEEGDDDEHDYEDDDEDDMEIIDEDELENGESNSLDMRGDDNERISKEGLDSDDELAMEAWLDACEEFEDHHREKLAKREIRAKADTVDQNVRF